MTAYKPEDLAAELGKPRSFVMTHYQQWPHKRVGREIRFSEQDVAAILASMHREPVADESDEMPGLTKRSRAHKQNAGGI